MTRATSTSPGGIVLLYHRVVRLDTDPQLLAVTPEHFSQHLEVLKKVAQPTALQKMLAVDQYGDRIPVAITFDDGYADNFQHAKPLLDHWGIPATIFATTGHTGTLDEFFWDELDRLLLQPNVLPIGAGINSDISRTRWTPVSQPEISAGLFTACADYGLDQWNRHRSWNVLQPAESESRQQLYLDLCMYLHRLPADERAVCLAQLQEWSGCGSAGRECNRMMAADELREISKTGLVEIGAHTSAHPVLATESIDRQVAEIRGSKSALEAILDRPVVSFSYPFGTRKDYTAATIAAVKAEGFKMACSNFTGGVNPGTDAFQIPRFIVRDWDGDEFERRLRGWFEGISHA